MSKHSFFVFIFQIIVIILFALFVRYDPKTAQRSPKSVENAATQIRSIYPMFQDVHVMIFVGFGFLMTFLKKFGLSSVSLNFMCATLAIQMFILTDGFLNLRCELPGVEFFDLNCTSSWPYIDVNVETMLSADFATASVLISFGVVLGVTSPMQLILMTVIEIVIFRVNELIGKDFIGAVDAGDTIFVHVFGAYFGLSVSKILYKPSFTSSAKEGSSYNSDLFSMIGTLFLWMYWPSFNAGSVAEGDAQQRALLNTFISLCGCTMATFAMSALLTPSKKFSMEHLQNATLAGGVAIGASADMIITPGGALAVGSIAGILSVSGFHLVQPLLLTRLNVHDTCGVNNLHGMPGLFGGMISVLMAGIASPAMYDKFSDSVADKSLTEIFPLLATGGTSLGQAGRQMLAILLTLSMSVIGGVCTGFILLVVGKAENMQDEYLYNDDWNIDNLVAKDEMPDEIRILLNEKPTNEGLRSESDVQPLLS